MLGLETTVSLGVKGVAGLPATLGRTLLNVYSITGGGTQGDTDDPILGSGTNNNFDPTLPGPGLDDHSLTVKVPLCLNQFPLWLAAFFGAETAAGTTPNYTHTFASGANVASNYVFIEHLLKAGTYRQHHSMKGETLEIDFDPSQDGFGMATLTFVGAGEVPSTTALTGTVANAPLLDRPAASLWTATYNGVAGNPILSGKMTYKNKLKRIRYADGSPASDVVRDGKSSFDGSIKIRYKDEVLNSDAIALTERALVLHLGRTNFRYIEMTAAHMRLARTPMSISGPDGVEMDMAWKAWQTAADPALLAVVGNANATAAL